VANDLSAKHIQQHLDTLVEASRLLADDSDYEKLEPELQKLFDFLKYFHGFLTQLKTTRSKYGKSI